MSKERIEIGTVVEVADAKQSINELRQSIEDSKTSLKGLNSGTEDYNNEIKGLVSSQKELIELQESLINKFEDTGSVTSNLNSNLSVATNTVNGMMGGFQALQGIMVLTGKENKNLVNTLVKLQAVSSVVQGFKQFTDAVKAGNMAFKIFNITVKSNPLMLLATSIITVIGLVKTFTSDVDDSSDSLEKLNEVKLDKIKNELDGLIGKLVTNGENFKKLLNDETKRLEEKLKYTVLYGRRIEKIQEQTKKEIALLKAKGATTSEIQKAELEGQKKILEINKERLDNEGKEVYDGSLEAFEKYSSELNSKIEKIDKATEEGNQKALDDAKKALEAYLKGIGVSYEKFNKFYTLRKDVEEQERAIREKQIDIEAKSIEENYGRQLDLEKELIEEKTKNKTLVSSIIEEEQDRANSIEGVKGKLKDIYEFTLARQKEVKFGIEDVENTINDYIKRLDDTSLPLEEQIQLYKDINREYEKLKSFKDEDFKISIQREEIEENILELNKEYNRVSDEANFAREQAVLDVENSKKYNDNLGTQIELLEKQMLYKNAIKDTNKKIIDDESQSIEVRLKALYEYNDAMLSSYYLEADINRAKLELKEKEREAVNATLEVTADSLMAMSDLAKEGTVVQKTLAIAGTTISTIAAAQNIYESTAKIPFVGKVLAPIAAATATLQGIKRVKEIAKVKVPNGKKGGSSGMPQPQILQSMPNVQQTVTKMDGDDLDIINKDSKVYVVESDITNQQRRVKVAENEASF